MAKILLSRDDNDLIDRILRKGLQIRSGYKWWVLRIALAISLRIPSPPDPELHGRPKSADRPTDLSLREVTGEGKAEDEDFTAAFRALLSAYHGQDLFADEGAFVERLQCHIRRGLSELRRSWREGNDFYDFLYQDIFFSRERDHDKRPSQDAAKEGKALVSALNAIGVRGSVLKKEHGPRTDRYVLLINDANDLDRLRRGLEKVAFSLGLETDSLFLTGVLGERQIAVDVPRPMGQWDWVSGSIIPEAVASFSAELPVCTGVDVLGTPFLFDLAETPHLFIAGTTGSGKSTIINLISRFYDIQKGEILINDRNVREYDLAFLRSMIGVVLQDVFLFSDSIYENITLYNPDIPLEQVKEAAKRVGAHEFIMRLPGGYDYKVRERGATLSLGQRQLIAFARVMTYNPRLLILDEATANIDTESEQLIQHAIDTVMSERSAVIIAHRLSTIRRADRIYVLGDGQVLESGTHTELASHPEGAYSKLLKLQFEAHS